MPWIPACCGVPTWPHKSVLQRLLACPLLPFEIPSLACLAWLVFLPHTTFLAVFCRLFPSHSLSLIPCLCQVLPLTWPCCLAMPACLVSPSCGNAWSCLHTSHNRTGCVHPTIVSFFIPCLAASPACLSSPDLGCLPPCLLCCACISALIASPGWLHASRRILRYACHQDWLWLHGLSSLALAWAIFAGHASHAYLVRSAWP